MMCRRFFTREVNFLIYKHVVCALFFLISGVHKRQHCICRFLMSGKTLQTVISLILLQVWLEKFYFSCLVAFIVYSWPEVTVGIDYNPEKAFEAFPLVFIRR